MSEIADVVGHCYFARVKDGQFKLTVNLSSYDTMFLVEKLLVFLANANDRQIDTSTKNVANKTLQYLLQQQQAQH